MVLVVPCNPPYLHHITINSLHKMAKQANKLEDGDSVPGNEKGQVKKNRGAQPGNKNAVGAGAPLGNKNGVGAGAPEKNGNAEKYGFFAKYLPKDTLDIMDAIQEKSPLDLIWDAIKIQYAAIIRAQKIMYVKDQEDVTTVQTGFTEGKVASETWQSYQAWEKQESFMKAQSRAVDSLRAMIKDYLELEGATKTINKDQVEDWKTAILNIAERRRAQRGRRSN